MPPPIQPLENLWRYWVPRRISQRLWGKDFARIRENGAGLDILEPEGAQKRPLVARGLENREREKTAVLGDSEIRVLPLHFLF